MRLKRTRYLGLLVPLLVSPAVVSAQTFSHEQLIEDARQVSELIESAHPDPYILGGGKIAYHLRLQKLLNAIPVGGATRDEFARLLRPFLAGVGDSHTELWGSYEVDAYRPGGVPLRFNVVEKTIYVVGALDGHQEYIGSRLVSVEGLPLEVLIERQRELVALENDYHVLEELCSRALWFAPFLQDLIPEWDDTSSITVEVLRTTGEVEELSFSLPRHVGLMRYPPTEITVPPTTSSGFVTDFLTHPGTGEEFAYLRVDRMDRYREAEECIGNPGHQYLSATDEFRDLVVRMAASESDTLVVDLRYNGGGHSLMADILVYFLYGTDTLREINVHALLAGGGMVRLLSQYYLDSPYSPTLDEFNQGREVPLQVGDYDFSSFMGASDVPFEELPPEEQLEYSGSYFWECAETFRTEFESEEYAGYYRPENVIVLVSPWTFSSGFTMTRYLWLAGATLVGTPSGQAANSFCNGDRWVLDHTGLEGGVSRMYYAEFPIDSDLAHTLPVHYHLSYEKLASYEFDPNAELLYALELVAQLPGTKPRRPSRRCGANP